MIKISARAPDYTQMINYQMVFKNEMPVIYQYHLDNNPASASLLTKWHRSLHRPIDTEPHPPF